jgi:septal ring factor EnvC (AmiA/AmiB activator)
MRYIISLILALSIFISFSSPVGAVSTVSGEARITTLIKAKPVLKSKLTKSQKVKLQKEIKQLELDIATYSANISDIRAKIVARKKAGITDNADLEAKMKALKIERSSLVKNLEYARAKLK